MLMQAGCGQYLRQHIAGRSLAVMQRNTIACLFVVRHVVVPPSTTIQASSPSLCIAGAAVWDCPLHLFTDVDGHVFITYADMLKTAFVQPVTSNSAEPASEHQNIINIVRMFRIMHNVTARLIQPDKIGYTPDTNLNAIGNHPQPMPHEFNLV
jgi:hypothetical protein